MKRVQILAHRGLVSAFVPENSIKSFADALSAGADVIETDIRCTKDGVPIIFHDADFKRMCGLDADVSSLTWIEVQTLDIGFGKRIPSLRDALLTFSDARFNLDIKSESSISATAAIVNELGAHSRVLVSSFSDARRNKTVALMKAPVKTSAGVTRVLLLFAAATLGLSPVAKKLASKISALQIPTHRGPLRLDSPNFVRKMQNLGLEVHFWTINEPAEMKRLINLGANGIVTDHCDLALAEIKN